MARLLLAAAAAALLALLPIPTRAEFDQCWALLSDAMRRVADAPAPAITSYIERGIVIEDGNIRRRENFDVAYHSNGLAYISDFVSSRPHLTNVLEPGPPLISRYGDRRSAWLGTIESTSERCLNLGLERYDGAVAYHLVLPDASTHAATLRAIWLDPHTNEIRKTIVGGRVWLDGNRPPVYPNFEVEFRRVGAYNVVRHITWKYRMTVYSQYSNLFGEYYFSDYSFTEHADENGPAVAASPFVFQSPADLP